MDSQLVLWSVLFSLVTAGATLTTAYVLVVPQIGVNIRQRDNGDYSLGLYLEHLGGRAIRNVTLKVRVNGVDLPQFRWPTMKAGQSIQVGFIQTRGRLGWSDPVTHRDEIDLKSLSIVAEYGWWWRSGSYGSPGKTLLDIRDSEATLRAMHMMYWNPKSSRDVAVEKACNEIATAAKNWNMDTLRAWAERAREGQDREESVGPDQDPRTIVECKRNIAEVTGVCDPAVKRRVLRD